MIARVRWLGLVAITLLQACKGSPSIGPESATTTPRPQEATVLKAVGRPFPLQGLRDAGGVPSEGVPVGSAGSLVLVIDAADCTSCLGIQAEAWETSRLAEKHHLGFALVIEGQDTASIFHYLDHQRMPGTPLLDPAGRVLRTLGQHPHPLVVWLGPSGRVITMVPRTMSAPADAVRETLDDARVGGVASPATPG